MMGSISLLGTEALLERTALARLVLAGLTFFWGARLAVQLFVYDARLWRGHRLNTAVHFAFTGMWGYLAAVYGWALWRQVAG
ncbi:MAG: hypothetical protein HY721_01455 [Planctomycetes bacterium]|nr:hypothetical protein [Planctomycetota bacterium]